MFCRQRLNQSKKVRSSATFKPQGNHSWFLIVILTLSGMFSAECCKASVQDHSQLPLIANQDAIFFAARNDSQNQTNDASYIVKFS